jgi:hypothetical protein
MDPAAVATAQRNLKALGYAVGKASDPADPAFQHAIIAFEKDQSLAEDGLLSPAVIDRLKLMHAALLKSAAAASRSATFVYSDGSARQLALAAPPPDGLASNAPANFMLPVKPGSQASYQFGKIAKNNGFKAEMTVTCQAGRAMQTTVPLGPFETIAVECRGEGSNPPLWRSLYSTTLGAVIRQEKAGAVRDLVALRPFTNDWPAAARTGLDWALTHALDAAAPGVPVQWSSTGVTPHFEIRATARLSGQEAGLGGKYAQQACRRFELVQSGVPARHYPGIACQAGPGVWSLPGNAHLAAPAIGVAARSLSAALRK